MTKYKLLKPIKNVEWNVGEVMETRREYNEDAFIHVGGRTVIYDIEIALLEHAGFIEEVDETPKLNV